MKPFHTPRINARYWVAITLASVFGTNLGDFYAHESGLGIVKGLLVLAVLAALVFVAEHFENAVHEAYYWLVIILIRTGATNIADYLAFRVRVPPVALVLALIALLCLFGWLNSLSKSRFVGAQESLSNTNAAYWAAMLTAGVFGTVVGDIVSHTIGSGISVVVLSAVLAVMLAAGAKRAAANLALYWTIVATARTAGTAIGDFLAESKALQIGLPLSTLLTGLTFLAVLVFWRSRTQQTAA